MSNHFDGYTAANRANLDITDLYVFRGRTGTVLAMNTNSPANPSYEQPGWENDAVYQINLDLTGDNYPDLALRASFSGHSHEDDPTHGGQRWSLTVHLGPDAIADPESLGIPLLFRGRTDTVHTTLGVKMFAGRAGEPFYIAAPAITAVATAVTTGTPLDMGDFDPNTATNAFAGTNVNTIVIELPNLWGLLHYLPIGVWGSVHVPTDDGTSWRQVDRAGKPLITTLYGLTATDDYHSGQPADDQLTWGPQIEQATFDVVEANNTQPDPEAYAAGVRADLMPDILRYRIGTPAQYTAGHRNGRNLTEDVDEDMYQTVIGKHIEQGLDASDATGQLRDQFPYLAAPI